MNKKPIRVLQIVHGSFFGPFIECARGYAALFPEDKYNVTTVFLTGKENESVRSRITNGEVIFLEFESKDLRGLKLNIIKKLNKVLAGREFQLCIAHRSKPTYIALFGTRLPVISVHHSFGDYKRPAKRWLLHLFSSRVTLFGVSNAIRDDLRSSFPRWPKNKIETLYNRINKQEIIKSQFTRKQAREHLELDDNTWVIANVARLVPFKDQATLIRGFAKALTGLPDNCVLLIIGNGRLETELKELTSSLGIKNNVRFIGYLAQAYRYFTAFDNFVLTSLNEPFGLVLLEAMAAGNPIICSDSGGAPEVINHQGKLFPPSDVEALSKCLIEESTEKHEVNFTEQILNHLDANFSDKAASNTFWNLEAVKQIFNQNT
ncbi:MAG: glycosyltransferase [Methylophaga sp.]|nr:glycosyltransferase [Methylophaga sp.]